MEFMQDPKDEDLNEVQAIEHENEIELWSLKFSRLDIGQAFL